jgi:hypothetical protein
MDEVFDGINIPNLPLVAEVPSYRFARSSLVKMSDRG